MNNSTICGIATGNNKAGVGIVRISGENALNIAEKILKKNGDSITPRFAYYGDFYYGDEVIDKGIALYFPAPNSFTGEDVLELQGHGGTVVMQQILESALQNGATLASGGEFSKRAFLNGKMDLAQAEAVADMIDSTSKYASKLALNSLRGDFSKKINTLREKIINLRIFVEATIDFVDEEIDFIADNKVFDKLQTIQNTLIDTLQTGKSGAIIKNGINIAIIGKPNAGKSSLLNALTSEESAIVSDIAGTTRDVVKEQITINGVQINLIDTAGIRNSDDKIESIGIAKAKDEGRRADIVLLVFENGETPDTTLLQENDNYILVENKIDKNLPIFAENSVQISAKNRDGMKHLKEIILQQAGIHTFDENTFIARTRHLEELQHTLHFVESAIYNLTEGSIELVADDLNQASIHLGKITGEFSNDELLGEIFSNFCIGK